MAARCGNFRAARCHSVGCSSQKTDTACSRRRAGWFVRSFSGKRNRGFYGRISALEPTFAGRSGNSWSSRRYPIAFAESSSEPITARGNPLHTIRKAPRQRRLPSLFSFFYDSRDLICLIGHKRQHNLIDKLRRLMKITFNHICLTLIGSIQAEPH